MRPVLTSGMGNNGFKSVLDRVQNKEKKKKLVDKMKKNISKELDSKNKLSKNIHAVLMSKLRK